jgi:GGDEF domain-containing protein
MDELGKYRMAGRWRRGLARAACWLALALAAPAQPAVAADPLITLAASDGKKSLGSAGEVWLDTTGEAIVDNVATDRSIRWAPTADGAIYPLHSGRALWFRFTLAELDDSDRWYLEIPYPHVNLATLYASDRLGQWVPLSAGDSLPVAEWPLPHRHPLLPLLLSPGTPQQFYVRILNPHSFSAPLRFTSERQLIRQEQRTALVLGLFFGLAGLTVVLAAVAAISLRDVAFGLYSLTVVLLTLTQASLTGVSGLHLWPRLPWWNDVSAMAVPVGSIAGLLSFFVATVSVAQRSARLHRVLIGLSAATLLAALSLLVVPPPWRYRIMVPAIVLGLSVGVTVLVWAWRRGDRHAGWLLAGMAPVALGSAFPLARTAGLIPASFWTTHAMQIAIAIELPLLLAVLMARSQDRRENYRRLHGLERTDPATGLINAQVFRERLAQLVTRSERLKHQSVAMLVDIANIEQVRRDFDRRSAEEMPLQVAGRLLSVARDIDSVARLSDHRFGLLVEGPLSAEEAAETGPKVVARCLMPFKGKPVGWVAQVRVAQTLVPNGSDAQRVIDRLDAVLAAVPAESKRAVFTIR